MFVNLLYILAALLIMDVIVVIHELGHYTVGRLCGIAVVEFSVGLGPRLLGFERNGIQYSLRAIPLGGYCKFVGEDEENPDPRAMNNHPVWKRFLTVAAGALMNFVLAFLAAVILFSGYGTKIVPTLAQVDPDSPAAAAGLRPGDQIVSINGQALEHNVDGVVFIQTEVAAAQDSAVSFGIRRGEEQLNLDIVPQPVPQADGTTRYLIGITFGERYGILESFPAALTSMREDSGMVLDALRKLVFKGEGAEDMAGTVGIINIVSQSVRQGWYMVFNCLYIISLNLGIMNLLPLPALDGGRLVFLIIEAIRRKPVPPEKEGLVHAIGLMAILVLFVILTFHDIARWIHG